MGAHAAQQATHSAAIMSRFGTRYPSDKSVFPTLDFSLRIRFRDRRLACIACGVWLGLAASFGGRLFARAMGLMDMGTAWRLYDAPPLQALDRERRALALLLLLERDRARERAQLLRDL